MIIAKHSPLLGPPRALLEVTKHLSIPPQRKNLRTISTRNFATHDELDKPRRAWKEYQSTRRRDAIYPYLAAVFKIVGRWKEQDIIDTKTHRALKEAVGGNKVRNREPFGVVIFCSSDPSKVDTRTRSKWARALRYAEQFKPEADSLAEFIKRRGGINECAARFSKRVTPPGNKELHGASR